MSFAAASLSAADAATPRWDYVIVGGGTAGLPAAIFASRRGARVLVIDAAPEVGGTLHIAYGQVSAAGTHLQQEKGIADSVEQHFDDVMQLSHGLADPGLVRLAVREAPATVNWLLDAGLRPLADQPETGAEVGRPGYSVPRYLWGKDNGRSILEVVRRELEPEVASGRVTLRLNTRATELLTRDPHHVVGVRALREDGAPEDHYGRHVLIATGGYSMNPVLFQKLVGVSPYTEASYPFAQGDGLGMGTRLDAVLRGRELHRAGGGSILSGFEFPAKRVGRFDTYPSSRPPWEIWVNARGERFIREDEPTVYEREYALVRQPEFRFVVVFDEAIFRAAPPGVAGWTREQMEAHFNAHPMFARAESLATLAERARVDAAGLARSVATYNAAVASGSDALGRVYLPRPLSEPPFYAITLLGHSATSSIGLTVDNDLRVLDSRGRPIQGLYAAGEVLGSGVLTGRAFVPGMLLTPALSLGRMLGRTLPI
jgi:fumarate reductase flavoprotein subunit